MTVCLSPNGLNVYRDDEWPRRLLVGTAGGVSILERESGGEGWRVSGHALEGLHISSLVLEPEHGGVFAGIHFEGGLYFSGDDGTTWEERTHGLTIQHVYSMRSVDEGGKPIIYAGTEPPSLFRSEDYGLSWRELPAMKSVPNTDQWRFPMKPNIPHTKTMAFDPRNPKVIYVGVEQGALLKTTDGGETWRELEAYSTPDDPYYKDIHQLVLQPSEPDELYMTSGPGLYHSTDGGETFEHLTDHGFRIGYPDQMLLSPLDPKVIFMAGSAENPGTWRNSHHAGSTVVRSRNGGRDWEISNKGLPESMQGNIEAMSMAISPTGFSIFAGTTEGKVYCTEDGAESWVEIATGLAPIAKGGHDVRLALPTSGRGQ
jgi:photosystem II stability/assembly factor-like uncharacterized protein